MNKGKKNMFNFFNPYNQQTPFQQNGSNPNFQSTIDQIRSAGPSDAMFSQLYNSNPAFKKFADSMKNKTPEQAFMEAGKNFNSFKHLKW